MISSHNVAMVSSEQARHWAPAGLPGVDFLRARYVGRIFPWHSHDAFVIAAISRGLQEFRHRGTVERAGAGHLVLINPETAHSVQAAAPGGWTYHVLYPRPDVVARALGETAVLRGTPAFSTAAVHDPEAARMVIAVHRAAERADMLTADTLLHATLARLLRRYGTTSGARPTAAGHRTATRTREVLLTRMAEPPALAALAAELGTGPHALLRAFKNAYGMPPHAWLNDARVRRARTLLDGGTPPAEAAATVGFVDQSHLSRHFTRIVGVPPGAYQRERRNDRPSAAPGRGRKNVQDGAAHRT
jgi:AraC-like DNA-binding protein